MGKQIGSQFRETLAEAKYTLVAWAGDDGDEDRSQVVLADEDGKQELWGRNDHHSGWTVEIDGVGYEFCHSLRLTDYRKV